jgi:hypothetical protein
MTTSISVHDLGDVRLALVARRRWGIALRSRVRFGERHDVRVHEPEQRLPRSADRSHPADGRSSLKTVAPRDDASYPRIRSDRRLERDISVCHASI